MFRLTDPFSSPIPPVVDGHRGTISCEHPLAASAGLRAYDRGGSAADAAIAAQAVLAVVSPDACGLGGDMLALIHAPDGQTYAINGTGALPAAHESHDITGAQAITVPGLVSGWSLLHRTHGRLTLSEVLAPAIALADQGFRISTSLARALQAQRNRLIAGGAQMWPCFDRKAGDIIRLPRLAALLRAIATQGETAFYTGEMADHTARAVTRAGGCLSSDDLAEQHITPTAPNATHWAGGQLYTQPPMTQGILLNMVLTALEQTAPAQGLATDHATIELTEAAFAYRHRAGEGMALMDTPLDFDPARAANRGGPRAYLHTAGVATADASGLVISSLVSVFDDFGSAVYVPEGEFTLNNRGAGFGAAPNDAAPGKRPVHTLAPALLTHPDGSVWAAATPGADGQIQTLAQVLMQARLGGVDLARAVAAPRWRSENQQLLIEDTHPHRADLAKMGHQIRALPAGDLRFGGLVMAGLQAGIPRAVADWRRHTTAGAV